MPTDLTREFLHQVVRGSGWSLAEVESLSLEGEGIFSLGDSFVGATRLVYLDLARNSLSSLLGVEHLASLATLILRENHVGAMGEVGRLTCLPSLRDLDLRLNPIMAVTAARARSNFGGEDGRGQSGSMSGSGGGGGSGNRRADLLRLLPRLARLNGKVVVEDGGLPRRHRRHQQQHQQAQAGSPRGQQRARPLHPGHQPRQQGQRRRPQGSAATPARPTSESYPRTELHDEGWSTSDPGLGTSGRGSRNRREYVIPPSEAAAVLTVASSRPNRTRKQPLPRWRPTSPQHGGDGEAGQAGGAGEDDFSLFFPVSATAEEAPSVPPPRRQHGEGRGVAVAAAGGGDEASPRILRSSESPRPRSGAIGRSKRFVDSGGCGAACQGSRDRNGDRYRQPGGSRALETEAETTEKAAAAAARRKRDRPGAGSASRSSCSLDVGDLSGLSCEHRCGEGRGSYSAVDGGRARAEEDCGREPNGPAADVGRGAAAVFRGGRTELCGRGITPPRAAVLVPPAAGEGDGDDLATLWLELGTDESLGSRQPSPPPSSSSSVAAASTAATTTTATVSAAERAVEAFRRSAQRLGLPATASDHGGGNKNPRDGRDTGSHGAHACPEGVSSALQVPSLAMTPAETFPTAASATTALLKLAAPSEGTAAAAVPSPKQGSDVARRTTACGGGSDGDPYVRCHPDGSAVTAGAGESAAAGRVSASAWDARDMDERWWAREREFSERWAAREREFDARWAAREREFDKRRREESKEFTAEMRSMLLGAHEALISSNAWLVQRLKTVEATAAAAVAEAVGPSTGKPPSAVASGRNDWMAPSYGPTEIGTSSSVLDSKKQAAVGGIVDAAVNGADLVPSEKPAPNGAETAVVARDITVRGAAAEPSGDYGWRAEGGCDDRRTVRISHGVAVLQCETERHGEDRKAGCLATTQPAVQGICGVRVHAETAVVDADVAAHCCARAVPPLGHEAGREGEGGVGVGASACAGAVPVGEAAPLPLPRGCGRGTAPLDRATGKSSSPDNGSEGEAVLALLSAPPGVAGAATVALRHAEGAADSTGGSGGEGMGLSSREGGGFGGDPEVTTVSGFGC